MRPRLLRTPVLAGKGDSGKKTLAAKNGAPVRLIERIERALTLAAYVVVRHGPVYAPLLDRLEWELDAARLNDPTERARRILEAYGSNQIRVGSVKSGHADEKPLSEVEHSRYGTATQPKRKTRDCG